MADEAPGQEQDLTVKGDSIESTYRNYRSSKYWVNRRYQRKLIWTLEEKQGFIDSLRRGFPVPIVLLAENTSRDPVILEIIDGMQRLNAIVSFIENEYALNDSYFDLNTMAVTKELLDKGELVQKAPMLDRNTCVRIASYSLPFSIFEFREEKSVDEVFRRINSGGRKLSRQELRAAGSLGHFATAVRRIAAQVRGDASHSDTLPLNGMAAVSITNRELEYGILVDNIFWVSQNILTKEQVRESRDEEIVADILAYMVLAQPPASRSEFFDDYFSRTETEASQKRYREIELAVQRRSVELVIDDFHRTLDTLRSVIDESEQTFGRLLFKQQPARAPRYFQVVFLAFYTLLVRESLSVAKSGLLISRLTNAAEDINVPEGGRWGGEDRHTTVQAAAGVFREAFEKSGERDPAAIHWITRIENLLSQSLTEQSLYDFKQGFLSLDGSNDFNEDSFEKILKTCAAIASNHKGCRGYVLVGVSDSAETTGRVRELHSVESVDYRGWSIIGVDHEQVLLNKTPDQMFQWITNKVSDSALSSPLKEYVARHIKPIRYFDKTVYVFEVEGQDDPSSYDGAYYDRRGAQLQEIEKDKLALFIRRYIAES